MEDKMREAKLGWFKHVRRRCKDAPVQRCEMLAMDGYRKDNVNKLPVTGKLIMHGD
ncbi:hypothetical protein H5410_057291 [Solanum commersonii]|uniref:Uncharacterized protein n=1 Tax=Solanum commersonii TaxID=4109 RepID=A0A9J5WP91_SOLCO|nr:hypothetical protein H5410_057291 [Solanum commersonii]